MTAVIVLGFLFFWLAFAARACRMLADTDAPEDYHDVAPGGAEEEYHG